MQCEQAAPKWEVIDHGESFTHRYSVRKECNEGAQFGGSYMSEKFARMLTAMLNAEDRIKANQLGERT